MALPSIEGLQISVSMMWHLLWCCLCLPRPGCRSILDQAFLQTYLRNGIPKVVEPPFPKMVLAFYIISRTKAGTNRNAAQPLMLVLPINILFCFTYRQWIRCCTSVFVNHRASCLVHYTDTGTYRKQVGHISCTVKSRVVSLADDDIIHEWLPDVLKAI